MALKSCREVVGLSMRHSHLKQKYKKIAMSVPCNTAWWNVQNCIKASYAGVWADLKPDEVQVLNPDPRTWILTDSQISAKLPSLPMITTKTI